MKFWSKHNARISEVDEMLLAHLMIVRKRIQSNEADAAQSATAHLPQSPSETKARKQAVRELALLNKTIAQLERRFLNHHRYQVYGDLLS